MNLVATTQQVGAFIIDTTEQWGRSWIFLYRTVISLFKPPYRPFLYMTQVLQIGVNSMLVIGLIGLFTGAVLAVQGEYTLAKFGATAYTGPAVALSLIRELGPVLTALMVIASKPQVQRRAQSINQGPSAVDMARLLIAKGADVNARSKTGVTPLMVAAP